MITDQTIIAATDVEWDEDISSYPASEYDLEIAIKRGSDSPKLLDVEKDGDTFQISIPNTLIAADEFGDYQFQYKFTNLDTDKISAPIEYRGFVKVLPDLSSDADTRTDDEKVLAALQEARIKVANRDYANVTINGKATTFKTLQEIDAAIVAYQKKLGIYKTPRLISSFG
jgi:hypothetical protein